MDAAGDLFIADTNNNVVREVTPAVTVTINLITNGGFEQPTPLTHDWGEEFSAGSHWHSRLERRFGFGGHPSGELVRSLPGCTITHLDGSQPGSIEQSFPTTIGTTYQFSFAYANNPDQRGTFNGPQTADVTVTDSGGKAC